MKEIRIRNLSEAEEVVRIARLLGRHGHAPTICKGSRRLSDVADRLFGADPQKIEFIRAARIAIYDLRAARAQSMR
jgi:hypothetical protein